MPAHRRRGAELERAILEAVRDQVDRHGYANTTYEGVAAAAGTGKAVLYRRWATKAHMVLAAMAADEQIELTFTVDTGSLADDLKLALRGGRDILDHRREMVVGLLADLDPSDPGWGQSLFSDRISVVLGPIVDQARARGELGDAPLPPRVLAVPLTMLRHDTLVYGRVSDDDIAEIVTTCIVPLFTTASRSPAGAFDS
ncbi:TetR/AcrR family transcriptional regulator [Gordonia sp. SL306]|uniref:TetR/AcrR family transcriptional regulator n=1 Tax=Gordonia sp. SL306 TaxID=2995145 RepID=UPI002271C9B4|nr:TetR/AcrR family transcriptional regulator [Gordonia sp. SL306]WAC53536.1 TetR/AcrR family transcriptional regulator [Gordonia sp. SL306]